ncbi:hypothetical protein GR212_15820 [Rhizobium lusitanum]|uniref:Uncharacterized protein n=1 Tax=Rhizobium lusitanum TaxID=293958 RepID=A0A6L9UAB3_9HYPH|nr:hypothetical protein [Rhizobium lusitanum]NEI71047.1 hypothetical protein [Rhizobium lusitanum]
MNAISIDEAFAQGSSWHQMASIAKFHESAINQKLNEANRNRKRDADWKARAARQQLEREVEQHRRRVDYFRGLAHRMRKLSEDGSPHAG